MSATALCVECHSGCVATVCGWNGGDTTNDSIFIAIVASAQHEFGVSTHILTNGKQQKAVTSKFNVPGCSTVKVVSQFDTFLETSVSSMKEGMTVAGLTAVNAFVEAKCNMPFLCADLKRVMEAAEVAAITKTEEEETCGLGCPAPQ